jgi:hypothetical protein
MLYPPPALSDTSCLCPGKDWKGDVIPPSRPLRYFLSLPRQGLEGRILRTQKRCTRWHWMAMNLMMRSTEFNVCALVFAILNPLLLVLAQIVGTIRKIASIAGVRGLERTLRPARADPRRAGGAPGGAGGMLIPLTCKRRECVVFYNTSTRTKGSYLRGAPRKLIVRPCPGHTKERGVLRCRLSFPTNFLGAFSIHEALLTKSNQQWVLVSSSMLYFVLKPVSRMYLYAITTCTGEPLARTGINLQIGEQTPTWGH